MNVTPLSGGEDDQGVEAFISYAREDRSTAQQLENVLSRHGVRIWWDKSLAKGSRWTKELQLHLSIATTVILLWSESASQSEMVEGEVLWALGKKRLFFLLLLDNTDLPPYLAGRQYSDSQELVWAGQ